MQKITPFLWFDGNAEDAANFYTTVFKDAKIKSINRYPEGSPAPAGSVMTVAFELFGQEFVGLNGGPHFKFTEAVSFVINCANQAEVDYYWDKLSDGGEIQMCGWLKDKFGLSWQIVPVALPELLGSKDPDKAARATQALMQMKKIDISVLENA